MKATGIVRKIDELGRIVIPKEIRKTMRISVGEPLEIFVEKPGRVVLKKYDPMSELKTQIENYIEVLSKNLDIIVLVTNMKKVAFAEGSGKKEFENADLTDEIIKVINKRNLWSTKNSGMIKITTKQNLNNTYGEAVFPIISNSDLLGSVVFICNDSSKTIGNNELKLLQIAGEFLAKQME